MKSILISIQPQWVEKILNGEKTIEIRKTVPKCEFPCKVYIYCTKGKNDLRIFNESVCKRFNIPKTRTYSASEQKGYTRFIGDESQSVNGKVVAEFTLNGVVKFDVKSIMFLGKQQELMQKSKLGGLSLRKYLGNGIGYAWHIDNLKIYDKPKELCEFRKDLDCDDYPCNKNRDCKYNYYDTSEGCWACGIDFDGTNCIYKQIKRPPQSWCYVEDLCQD